MSDHVHAGNWQDNFHLIVDSIRIFSDIVVDALREGIKVSLELRRLQIIPLLSPLGHRIGDQPGRGVLIFGPPIFRSLPARLTIKAQ